MTNIANFLMSETCKSMSVFESNLGFEVRMPNLYPSGEHLSIIVSEETNANEITLHDGGFALMSVASMGLALKPRYNEAITNHARSMGCDFSNGRVIRKCAKENVAAAAMTIANVCLFITSLAAPIPKKSEDFADLVREKLKKEITKVDIEPKFKALGNSGGEYEVTAALMRKNSNIPEVIFEAVGTPKSVNSRFRHLYDIGANPDYADTVRVSIYDDRESFAQSDLILLQAQSNVVAYPDLGQRITEYV